MWRRLVSSPARTARPARRQRPAASFIEELEARVLLSSYTPAQIGEAYGFDQIMFGDVKGDGTGQTIAIVSAYNAPNIQADLAKFNATFGLPTTAGNGSTLLTVANPQGQPTYNAAWAKESTLDVEWAHAIAPGANILLVQASSNTVDALVLAVDYARKQTGVSVVSMSWGAAEFAGMSTYDAIFTTPAGHQGVSFVASAGNTATIAQFPAMSPNVLAVGGTTLTTSDALGTYSSETGWYKSGGGISKYAVKPDYQAAVTYSSTQRTGPDVGYVANSATGVQVYFTDINGAGAWYTLGGTSVGAPQWAALVAIANQGLALKGQDSLEGRAELLPAIYSMPGSNFHDVTSGTTTNGTITYTASVGYDLITGRGSPRADLVVASLLNVQTNNTTSGSTGGSTGGTTSGGGGNTTGGKGGGKKGGPKFNANVAANLQASPNFEAGAELSQGAGIGPALLFTPSASHHEIEGAARAWGLAQHEAGRTFETLFVTPGSPLWSSRALHEGAGHVPWPGEGEPASCAPAGIAQHDDAAGRGLAAWWGAEHGETGEPSAALDASPSLAALDRLTSFRASAALQRVSAAQPAASSLPAGDGWLPPQALDEFFTALAECKAALWEC
ncbi:MAG: S53 family peptidase [Planctomycetaceae bacterium]